MAVTDLEVLAALSEALKKDRLVGVVQVQSESEEGAHDTLYHCGCLARILELQESEKGILGFSVQGLCRFDIKKELPEIFACRKALVSYTKYERDTVHEADFLLDRKRLLAALRLYCDRRQLEPLWEPIETASNEKLMATLMMVCPFTATERQTLLETVGYTDQSNLVTSLMEMDALIPVSSVAH